MMLAPDSIYWSDKALFALAAGDPVGACDALASCARPIITTSFYLAIALALAGRDATAAAASARQRLSSIWIGPQPDFGELVGWFDRLHPFLRTEQRRWLRNGLAAALGRSTSG